MAESLSSRIYTGSSKRPSLQKNYVSVLASSRLRPKIGDINLSKSLPSLNSLERPIRRLDGEDGELIRSRQSDSTDLTDSCVLSGYENPVANDMTNGKKTVGRNGTILSLKFSTIEGESEVDLIDEMKGGGGQKDMRGLKESYELDKSKFIRSLNLGEKELHRLCHVPQTFYYLGPICRDSSAYALKIISQGDVDMDLYCTISKEGVTHYNQKQSQFTSLQQFEREFHLFGQISRIRFFRQYRLWKTFSTWKRGLRFGKIAESRKLISSSLFIFVPPLRDALLKLRSLCLSIGDEGMLDIKDSETYVLEEFVHMQLKLHNFLREKFTVLSRDILLTVRSACDVVVDDFLRINNIVANHRMTFMERATLRAECRALTRFLRLSDLITSDFLRTMVQEMLLTIVSAVDSRSFDPKIITDDSMDLHQLKSWREENRLKPPLFRIFVYFPDEHAEISKKSLSVKPNVNTINEGLDSVINSALDIVSALGTVFDSPDTEMYVMWRTQDGDEEDIMETVDIATIIKNSQVFSQSQVAIQRFLKQAFSAVRIYASVFERFGTCLYVNESYMMDDVTSLSTVNEFVVSIEKYKQQVMAFANVPRFADVGVLLVDSTNLKAALVPSPVACLKAIQEWLPSLAAKKLQELLDEIGTINPIIAGDPSSVEGFVKKKKIRDDAAADLETYNERQSFIRQLIMVLEDNHWSVPDNIKALSRMLREAMPRLENNIQVAEGKEEDEVKKFSSQVLDDVPKLVKNVNLLREDLDKAIISDPDADTIRVIKYLTDKSSEFDKYKKNSERLQEYQGVLKLHVEDFELLDEIGTDLNLKLRLWQDRSEWATIRETVLTTHIQKLDVQKMEKDLTRFNKTAFLASKGFPNNKVVPLFKAEVEVFNPVLPVIINLRNESIKERHWAKISDILGFKIQDEDNFTVHDLVDRNVTKHDIAIATIATSAQQESILEEMMSKVTTIWRSALLDVRPYKDVKDLFILGDTTDIIANLDDCLVTINTVLGSRYVAGIRDFVDGWRGKLMHLQETLDEWLTCQRNWMYLETIFGSPDIIRQLPGPAKTFQAVDKSWRFIMKQTYDEPNAMVAGTKDKSRRDVFRGHNMNLDQIQKDLEDYLETKRMAFPRFYFLSNDELLEILSQAKEPRAVQPHMRKCFDNLVRLEFGPDDSIDILGMFSGEGEKVLLGRNLKARGNVEDWLNATERRMKEALHSCMKAGLIDYDQRSRDEWTALHPGQVVATVAQITWARETEKAIKSDVSAQVCHLMYNPYG
jgi:dynein heavy chain